MSLARAFTTRRARHTLEQKDKDGSSREGGLVEGATGLLHRSKTTKALRTHGSIRNKISGPVELTHTTNMLSYNAPDIFPQASSTPMTASPSSSTKSDDESDSGSTAPSSAGSTDASSPPTSPDSPYPKDGRTGSPEPNHLSCYFTPPSQSTAQFSSDRSVSPNGNLTASPSSTATVDLNAPAIPKRAPSHTKKSYEGLARNRSTSRMSEQSSRSVSTKASFSFSRSSSSSTSTSVASQNSHVKPTALSPPPIPTITVAEQAPPVSHKAEFSEAHPFGHELAKVSELVEEFGKEPVPEKKLPQPEVVNEEERELLQQGLKKFSAEDYLSEIHDLVASFLADARPMATVWI